MDHGIDYRLGGVRQSWVGGARDLMRIPDKVTDCVAFVGMDDKEDNFIPTGTVFFVIHGDTDRGEGILYAISASHTIENILSGKGKNASRDIVGRPPRIPIIRDSFGEKRPANGWITKAGNERADIAVLPWQSHHKSIHTSMFASDEVIRDNHIGIGDDTIMVGLFVNHPGSKRNYPIVRTGSIAMMPNEEIATTAGAYIPSYLVETHSLSGLSGCPMFIRLGPGVRTADGEINEDGITMFVLGMVLAHCSTGWTDGSFHVVPHLRNQSINSGIAVVAPTDKIIEALKDPRVMKHREAEMEKRRRGRCVDAP